MKKSGPLFFKPERRKPAARVAAEQTLRIERLSAEGRGMAFVAGKPVFVAHALPGETVRARIETDRREYAEARLLEVLEAAPQRVPARCPLFGDCGGCQLQMLDYAGQVEHKQRTLQHLLAPFAPRTWDEPLLAGPWHYRHRARLAVSADAQGKPQLAFKSAGSHRSVAVRRCDIVDSRLQPLLEQVPQWLARLGKWRRIEEIVLVVDSAGKLALAYRAEAAFPAADRALLQQLAHAAGVGLADAELQYEIPGQQVKLDFRARDFTQVNPAINDRLAGRCIEWLQPEAGESVADFFCGLGNFSLPIARRGARVTGYEVGAEMVARAARNAAAAGIDGAAFEIADLFETSPAILAALPAAMRKALLDPPRAGAKLLCEGLAKSRLQTIVYVSCNPHTLVRDLQALAGGGFAVERAALVDMFPQTGHIEAMVLCRR
jgi:23S rRNA (uracil1939-C5)-methyltransferase